MLQDPNMSTAATASSPSFQQLLSYLQQNLQITQQQLQTYLESSFGVPSDVAPTVASIVTQALSNQGTITFTSNQPTLTLAPLCQAFGFTLPSISTLAVGGFSLEITTFTLDLNTSTLGITGQCTGVIPSQSGGSPSCEFFVTAIDDPVNGWTLVFGADLGTDFSNFPVIGSDVTVPLDLAAAFAVVSTGSISGFTIPSADPTENPFAGYPIDFAEAGVMIAALLDLSSPSTTCATNLANFNNPPSQPGAPTSDPILITADISSSGATLTAELGQKTIYDCTLDLKLNIGLQDAGVSIALTSSITLTTLTFDMSIDLTAETLFFALTLQSSSGISLPGPLSNVQIDSILGLIGIDFAYGEADIGIAAVFGFNAPPSGASSPTAVSSLLPASNSTPAKNTPVPAPSKWECALIGGVEAETGVNIDLALLSVDQISFADICNFLCPALPSDLGQALNGISLNNILIYWCDDMPGSLGGLGLTLPDGSALSPGFIFQGGLTWGSFSAFANISVTLSETSSSCSGRISISPFSIGSILTISGDGTGQNGVKALGPVIEFNTNPNPYYLNANWSVAFLDVPAAGTVTVDLTGTELKFSVKASEGSLVSGYFDCQLDPAGGWFNFQCSGSFDDNFSVDIDIPGYNNNDTISLGGCTFSASVSVTVNDGFTGTIEATFEYQGLTLTVPTIPVSVSLSSVTGVVDAIFNQIKTFADSIFSDMITDITNLGIKVIGDLETDIKGFVSWLTGDHGSNTPDYLQNNALITNGVPVFQVEGMKLRWVPDPLTLEALDPNGNKVLSGMAPVIAALPQDVVMVPSRMDGTVLQRLDDGQWFLIASDYQNGNSGPTKPAKYAIQNAESFSERCSGPVKVAWQVNQYGAGNKSADDEIQPIPDNGLLNQFKNQNYIGSISSDASQGANYGSISMFNDGIRYHVGPNLWYYELQNWHGSGSSVTQAILPDIAYSNMPQYQGLGDQTDDYTIDIEQGCLYKSDSPAKPDIYYASTGSDGLNTGLYYVSYAQWVNFWQSASPILIPDALWQVVNASESNRYPCTNPPPNQLTWVCNLGSGGNGVWPAGQQGNSVEYGVSFVNGTAESRVTWGPLLPITGYMCAELGIPTDSSNPATARNIYRQFLYSGGSNLPQSELVGTINNNTTTVWQDTSPAYNIAAPPQIGAPEAWQANLPIANSQVWQAGNQVQYALTYAFSDGETALSDWSDPITVTGYAYPIFTDVPICPTNPSGSGCIPNSGQSIMRNIYRQCTSSDGNVIESRTLVGQLTDNKTKYFIDEKP